MHRPLQHLKSKFGSGFEMSVRVSVEEAVDSTLSFLMSSFAGAELQERRGCKLTLQLPQTTRLSAVFQQV